jgi:hypothetical protein
MKSGNNASVYNRNLDSINPPKCHCIASQCMAWWIQDELVVFVVGSKTVVSEGEQGYCGLVGKL